VKQAKSCLRSAAILLAGVLFLAACSSEPSDAKAPAGGSAAAGPSGEPIIVSLPADVTKLDPPTVSNAESLLVIRHIYDRLTEFADTQEVVVEPSLAKSWDVSEDGLRYTFHLRDDAFFSDGTPVTAEAVQFSLERIFDENHPAHWGIQWQQDIISPEWFDRFEIADERTIAFVLKEPFVPLLSNLAIPAASIVNPKHVLAVGQERSIVEPMGSGPYELAEWSAGSYVRLKARDHWRGRPKTDSLIFRVQKDANQRMAALRKGDVHVVTALTPSVVGDRAALKDCKVVEVPTPALSYLAINCAKDKFKDKRVRMALNYAVDRKVLCEGILEGTAFPATGIIPPGMIGWREEKPLGFSYDPAKAKALLKEAGAEGLKVQLLCYPEARPYNTAGTRTAQRIQEDLRAVGVEAELVQRDFGGVLEILSMRTEHELGATGWMSDSGDPDNFIYVCFGSPTNRCNYANAEANALMAQARSERDEAKRATLYQQAEDAMLADPPALLLNHANRLKGYSTRLKGYDPMSWSLDGYWNAYIE